MICHKCDTTGGNTSCKTLCKKMDSKFLLLIRMRVTNVCDAYIIIRHAVTMAIPVCLVSPKEKRD